MKVTLSDGKELTGLTLAEGNDGVYVVDEDRIESDTSYDGPSRISSVDLIKAEDCVSIVLKGSKEVKNELYSEYIKYADEYKDDMYTIELTPVTFAEQESDDNLYIEFQDGSSQTVSGTLQCAYVY